MKASVQLPFLKFRESPPMHPGRFLRQCGLICFLICGFNSLSLIAGQQEPSVEGPELSEPTEKTDAQPPDSPTETPPPSTHPEPNGQPSPVGRLLLRWLGVPVDPASGNQGESDASQRDPFETTRRMREAAQVQQPQASRPRGVPTLPELTLRGTAQGSDRPAVAILEVDGGETVVVREGETIGLAGGGPGAEMRVTKITQGAVHLQIEELGQTIVVR